MIQTIVESEITVLFVGLIAWPFQDYDELSLSLTDCA
jgi:hypothetical protein